MYYWGERVDVGLTYQERGEHKEAGSCDARDGDGGDDPRSGALASRPAVRPGQRLQHQVHLADLKQSFLI